MTRVRSRLSVLFVAAVLGAALVFAGCGGSSNDDYKKNVTQAAKTFQADAQAAGSALGSSQSPAQFKAAAVQFKGAVNKFTTKLKSLDPPSGVKDDQDKLVTDLDAFQGTIEQITQRVAAARSGDTSQIQALATLAPKLQTQIQTVRTDAQALQDAVNKS